MSTPDRKWDDAHLERLIAACARGDAQALRALYDATAPYLLAAMMRILRRRALAEETLQEVFVSIWQNAAKYEPRRGRPRVWLFSIARHRAIDAARRERAEGDIDSAVDNLPDPAGLEASERLTTDRLTAALERCLGLLNGDQQRGIRLAFIDGLSHSEIAEAVGEPLGTVKSWIRRGLLSLRECLDP